MLVSKEHRKLVLNLNDPQKVLGVIPTAQMIQHQGHNLVVVPHRLDEVRVLRNLGFDDAPLPVRYYYDFPIQQGRKPLEHQVQTVEFLVSNHRAFVLNEMGTMKTLSTLWAFDFLRKHGLVKRALILAPLSALERAWGDEIAMNFPDMSFGVLHGTREQRHKLLAHPFDAYIINHDGIKNPITLDLICKREDIDCIVIDELAEFRTSGIDRHKALRAICGSRKWVWGLTGTPIPNAPTDAFAQCQLINPNLIPKYFSHFRDMVMKPITAYKWAPREDALDTVYRVMQPAIRFTRSECLDLPETTYATRHAPLTPEQDKAYKSMQTQMRAEFKAGEITAVNEAVKLGKLIQICTGVAYHGDENIVIPAHHRIELTKDIIREAGAKVIVFVPLTGALEEVAEQLRKEFTVEVVHGSTPKRERDRIFSAFQKTPNPHVLVANPGTMSHSLTLTAANTIVWFAPIGSNNIYEQANARVPRPGQKLETLIVHIEGSAIERKMYERLQKRQSMQGILLDMFKGASR